MKNDDFSKRLKERGLKATPQRILILKVISEHGHVEVEKIYEEIKKLIPSISIATIYKNLKTLEDFGLIKGANIARFKGLYEVNTSFHLHIVCKKCSSIIDVEVNKEEVKKYFSKFTDIDVEDLSITLFGNCKKCSRQNHHNP